MNFTYIGDQSNKEIRTTGSYANSAYTQANTATSDAAGGSLYANGSFVQANSAFTKANTATNNAAGASLYANGAFILANAAYEMANSGSGLYTSASFLQANSAYAKANTSGEDALSAGTYANISFAFANSAGLYANAAFITANNALPKSGGTITGSLTVTQDVSVTGNLTILGTSTSINTSSFTVQDTMLILGLGNYTSDLLDIGFASHYNDGSNAHTGLIRDSSEKQWMFFEGYTPEVSPNNNINITDASFKYANVRARDITGNLIANTVTVNGYNLFNYTTDAYTQANTATTNAATADSKAVTSGSYANSAYTQANTATTNAATADSKAVTAGSYANSAYTQANTATSDAAGVSLYANGAFIQANAAFAQANTGGSSTDAFARDTANAAFAKANTSYSLVSNNSISVYTDSFIANGFTTTFTLSANPPDENFVTAIVDGITQQRNTYTVANNIITFNSTFENGASVEVTTLSGNAVINTVSGGGVSTGKSIAMSIIFGI